ncbi:hypothetical protein [Chamaesiphon sp. GL140_3_metabinner_50]|uniref:hypothetical protein n=1 Tax=Chamaesiphon sp. GL140_3_metabinner_50 TaxID=2970812 RepID=UPI0025D1B937|nr:hypothetical protein [Chamaesiphon sp. GL140_3_metabinner_50]
MDISESIERAVGNYFTQWFAAHPYLTWLSAHPLVSLGLCLLIIFSAWGLIKAIGRGIEQTWLFVLTTPFKLLQPIFGLMWRSIRRKFGHNNTTSDRLDSHLTLTAPTERVTEIVDRLHALTQEQQQLLSELAQLTGETSIEVATNSKLDTQYKNMYAKLLKLN